jgi:hypothetical protein
MNNDWTIQKPGTPDVIISHGDNTVVGRWRKSGSIHLILEEPNLLYILGEAIKCLVYPPNTLV